MQLSPWLKSLHLHLDLCYQYAINYGNYQILASILLFTLITFQRNFMYFTTETPIGIGCDWIQLSPWSKVLLLNLELYYLLWKLSVVWAVYWYLDSLNSKKPSCPSLPKILIWYYCMLISLRSKLLHQHLRYILSATKTHTH